ncbi:MAG TPA: hypothetical protein VF950_14060 [Planctomycetota bacterium]
MRRIMTLVAAVAATSFAACGGLPMMGGGGGAGGYKPAECQNNQFGGDLSSAKEGQFATYVADASGTKMTQTVKVVGKSGADWLVEHWTEAGPTSYGFLFQIGGDRKIRKAWAAAKGDKEWTSIAVKEPAAAAGDAPKARIKESSEKKDVKAGSFDCKRVDATVNVQGKDYESSTWFSKDAPKLYIATEHGGAVAMEASGSKTWLEAKGDDAKPTLELPKS